MKYFQVTEQTSFPDIGHLAPFKVVLVVEETIGQQQQHKLIHWLISSGGRYVMLAGKKSPGWEKHIRQVNLELFDIDDMHPKDFVMITPHSHEKLRNVFWHARKIAKHPNVEIEHILTVHVGNENRSVEYLTIYEKS